MESTLKEVWDKKNLQFEGAFLLKYKDANSSDLQGFKFEINDTQKFQDQFTFPSVRGMRDLTKVTDDDKNPSKYFVKDNGAYQIKILDNLNQSCEGASKYISTTSKIDQIINWIDSLKPDVPEILAYKISIEDIKVILIYKFTSQQILKNRLALVPSGKKISVVDGNKFFALPFAGKNCIASYICLKNGQKIVEVYKPISFDFMFRNSGTQKQYVTKNFDKFEDNEYKLAEDKVIVDFKGKLDDIKNVVFQNDNLTKTLASYTNNSRKKINTIDSGSIKNVINVLETAVNKKGNSKINIKKKNIPKFKNDHLTITKDSIPTFVALLDNKIIEKLLDGKIEIPFYEK